MRLVLTGMLSGMVKPEIIIAGIMMTGVVSASELCDAAKAYLDKKCSSGEVETFNHSFQERCQGAESEEGKADDEVVDFFHDHQKELQALKEGVIKKACMYLCYFEAHGYQIPSAILDSLSEQDRKDILAFLKEEAKE